MSALFLVSLSAAQAQTTLVDWTFDNAGITAPVYNPAPSEGIDLSTAVASAVGMTNSLTSPPSIGAPDVIANPATNSDSTPSLPDAWRIRAKGASPNNGNGWDFAAPIGTQGAMFTASTAGYTDIQLTFDVSATTQGEGYLQVEYTTDGVNWSNAPLTYPSNQSLILTNTTPIGAGTNGLVVGTYLNMVETGTYGQQWYTNVTANLSGLPGVDNNPNFAVAIVNAATGTNCLAAAGTVLNNTSGNWSLDNVAISGTPLPVTLTIAQWTFENLAITNYSPDPAPSLNNSLGAVSVAAIGMDVYSTPGVGTNDPDILQGVTGDSDSVASGGDGITNTTQIWRVRAQGAGNGWSSEAPVGTQGAQFNVDTTGFTNPVVSFDWYLTKQGEANLQLEYTTDGINWSNVPITIPAAQAGSTLQFVDNTAGSDPDSVQGYYVNSIAYPDGQQWFTNLTATISDPAAANDPNFAIRLVNASTGVSCVSGTGAALNNSSGNWRFDNITISGTSSGAILTPPVITPSPVATVDGLFTNTFTDSASWRSAITGITVNGTALPDGAYAVSAGQIVFAPSASTLLQTAGSVSIAIAATGYAVDTVSQYIAPGAPTHVSITAQPVAPTGNGGTLVAQPAVAIADQYGNPVTNNTVTCTATVGSGSWSFGTGSGISQTFATGTATFTNLSAVSAAAVSGAIITFNLTGSGLGDLPSTTNASAFNIPAPSTAFTPGDLAVFQEDVDVDNSTFSILELNPNTANQSSPVNIFPISATGTNAMRMASSATTGRLADSDDGTLLCFAGFEDGSSLTPDETAITPRGVGTLNAAGNYVLQMSYTGMSGNQTRSANTFDDTNYYAGDKGGIYINNGTAPFIGGSQQNVRSLKTFGGTLYALQQEGGTVPTDLMLQIIPDINGNIYYNGVLAISGYDSYWPVDGFPQETNVLDFYMVKSGNNGNIFDVVYYIDGTNANSGAIYKYYYSGTDPNNSLLPQFTLAGHWDTTNGGDGLCVATNASGGFDLYYTTGSGGQLTNSVIKMHDSAAWDLAPNMTSTDILYTATGQATLKGVAFAPVPSTTTTPVITPLTITARSTHITGSGTSAALQFSFTNTPGLTFSILATNNVTAPTATWPVIGTVTDNPPGSGQYQFTDPNAATNSQQYYILRYP